MGTYKKVTVEYTYTLQSLMKIGAGYGKNSFIDNAIRTVRTSDNTEVFTIPGTSVKGRIRANFEQLAHILSCGNGDDLFGKSGQPGWAHFSSLVSEQPVKVNITTSTSVDRFRKAAKNQSLRVEEYAQLDYNDSFHGTIEGFMPNDDAHEKTLYSLLVAMLNTTYFGGDKSVGYGKGQLVIQRVSIGEKELDMSTLTQYLQQQLTM